MSKVAYSEVKDMVMIHHGSRDFYKDRFKMITNGSPGWCKPHGGLWTSPINSEWGWKDWCRSEKFAIGRLCSHFTMRFWKNTRVYKIDNLDDLKALPFQDPPDWAKDLKFFSNKPDFEEILKEGVQAIWLTKEGERRTRWGLEYSLYGWDCETVLILDPSCIKTQKHETKLQSRRGNIIRGPRNKPGKSRRNNKRSKSPEQEH